jgi:hypothetical protein
VMLRGLLVQFHNSKASQQLSMNLFIVNTDSLKGWPSSPSFEDRLRLLIKELNGLYGDGHQVKLFFDKHRPARQYRNLFYGYDESDKLLDHLMTLSQCDWVLFTNGDNMYHSVCVHHTSFCPLLVESVIFSSLCPGLVSSNRSTCLTS